MAVNNIIRRMNNTKNEATIKKCKQQLKNIGFKVIYDNYTKQWILVW